VAALRTAAGRAIGAVYHLPAEQVMPRSKMPSAVSANASGWICPCYGSGRRGAGFAGADSSLSPPGGPACSRANAVQREYFPWLLQQVRAADRVPISSMTEARRRPPTTWRSVSITGQNHSERSRCRRVVGPTFGALSFHTVLAERTWPEEVVNLLPAGAQVFANAVGRKHTEQALRESEEPAVPGDRGRRRERLGAGCPR